jgi:hypothetical protein
MDKAKIDDLKRAYLCCSSGGAGGSRTHDLTDYESAALTC